jgi:hypothetical protein
MSTAEQYRKLAVEHIMLDQFSDQVRECHGRAAEAKAKAHATDDPILKADLFDMERRWLALARNYGCAESLEGFTTVNSKQRRTFDQHLQQSNVPVDGVRKDLDGPDDILQLHEISTLLIQEGNLDTLYDRILDAAIRLMSSDDQLLKSRWAGAELSSIATQELAPYLGNGDARARVDGPHVLLAPNMAQAIAVTLHELVTNAVKYGSLSTPSGQVEVTWIRAPDGLLILQWTETGGPPAKMPTREGFGATVIQRMIREQLKGEMHLDWRTEGFACEILLKV